MIALGVRAMNRRLCLLPLVVLALSLGGCSLAPEYTRPRAPVPANWPQGPAYEGNQAGAKKAPDLTWRKFFPDQRLQKVIALALKNNRDLKLAALNVERARALYGIQRAELAPTLNLTGAGSKQQRSADLISSEDPRTIEQYSVNLGVISWEIDFFGRIRSLEKQALQEYLATDQARRSARIALMAEVARAYFTLAADRENLALAKATLQTQEDSYSLVKKRFDAGVATELDRLRAQSPLDSARLAIARYQQAAAQDKNALDLLAGGQVPEELLPQSLEQVTSPTAISAGLPSEVLLRRPDIMSAELRLKGAYAFIGAARAALFPRISLTSSIGTASDQLSGLFGSGTGVWSFVPQITMPIFDARAWAALRVSKADREILLTAYEKAIQTAFREVADSLALRGSIDRQVTAQRSLVDAAVKAHRLASARYTQGIDSYLSVLDAQRTQFNAQQALVALRLTKLASQARLYAVLGGGSD